MLENSYHSAPILEDGRQEGVFTHTHLMEWVEQQGGITLQETDLFERLREPCSQERPRGHILLLPARATVPEVEGIFVQAFRNRTAITGLLITSNGLAKKKLLGLVTAHDLPSATGARYL
jgi:CBS domain-containing protein